MHQVFVYGTLKEGFPNADVNKGVRTPGVFKTKDLYSLYLVSERHTPWLIPDNQYGYNTLGEVYTVNDAGLVQLDELEAVGDPQGYKRVTIVVEHVDSAEELEAFIYLKTKQQLDQADIQQTLCDVYTRDHAQKYKRRQ